MTLRIPDGITEDEAQQLLDAVAVEFLAKKKDRDCKIAVLECDDALNDFCYQNEKIHGPIVRASTYQKVEAWQEFNEFVRDRDARRPVVMRGARSSVIAAHSYSYRTARNGYCDEVLKRYIRYSKASIFDIHELREFQLQMELKIQKKHWPNNWKTTIPLQSQCLVKGRYVVLNDHQREYIRKLTSIRNKTRDLDARLARRAA